jgi:hypothetical protein
MGFASKPSFRISERALTYETARQHFKNPALWHRNHSGANISDRRPGDSHYWIFHDVRRNPITGEQQSCYYLRMYRTDIHTWWEDGTYRSIYWDSAITRDVLTAFGPVRVWRDSRCKFDCKQRFGLWHTPDRQYPYGDGIVVTPEGIVRNLIDHYPVLRPGARTERTQIRDEFRKHTTSRILLGEFNIDFFARHKTDVKKGFGRYDTGWMAQIPVGGSGIATGFYQQAEHEVIRKRIEACWQWSDGPVRPTKEAAVLVAIDMMAAQVLSSSNWYEKQPVVHGDVNVKEL